MKFSQFQYLTGKQKHSFNSPIQKNIYTDYATIFVSQESDTFCHGEV